MPSRRASVALTVLGAVLLAGAAVGLVRTSSSDTSPDGRPARAGVDGPRAPRASVLEPAGAPPTATTLPHPPRTVTGDRAGFATTWTFERARHLPESLADIDAMAATGARWIRLGARWGLIERRPGEYDWSTLDRLVEAAVDHGMSVLGFASGPPEWQAAPGCRTTNCAPRDLDAYARFLATAAARYAPLGVRHWEVWNEPNLAEFWSPRPDPAAYAELQRLAYTRIAAAVPTAVVITGGLAPAGDAGGDVEPLRFMEEVYRHGAQGYFDAVGVHPYAFPYRPSTAAAYNTFLKVPALHELMAAHGDGSKLIWGTEVGAPTRGPRGVGEDGQARWLAEYYGTWNGWSFTGPLLWYEIRDAGGSGHDIDSFGLLRPDRSPKPGWRAFRSMVASGGRLPPGAP